MCFAYEADWSAQVQEESSGVCTQRFRCNECRREIPAGAQACYIYQREWEDCQDCENGYCDCEEDRCCQCNPPNYGETYNYQCCEDCWKFRQAVKELELEEGCAVHEAQPLLGYMFDNIQQLGGDYAKRYWLKALRKCPELKASGYLGQMWNELFVGG